MGGLALAKGVYLVVNAKSIADTETNSTMTLIPKEISVSGQSPPYVANIGGTEEHLGIVFNFWTDDVFSTFNLIHYDISVYASDRSLIRNVILIFGTPNQNYSGIQIPNATQFVNERSKLYGDTVLLFPDQTRPDYFVRKGQITIPTERQLVLHFITTDIYNHTEVVPTSDPIISITSATAKLQADTNRSILNSIKAQATTNNTVEGLTLIMVGAIPIGIGSDMTLRYYFNRK